MAFVRAASRSDLCPGEGLALVVSGQPIALYLVENAVYAIQNVCSHRGARLTDGACEGLEVVCPWHDSRFDLKTGDPRTPPATRRLRVYPVHIENGEVFVDVSDLKVS